jgi:integrase
MSDLIGAYMARMRAAGYAVETLRVRGVVLARAAADLPHGLDNASDEEISEWLGRPALSRWTRYGYFEHLAGFYAWAVARGHLDLNPMAELRRPRVPRGEPRPASEDQVAVGLRLPRPYATAVELAAFNGLRCAEIAGLSTDDVTAEAIAVHRKGGRVQVLPTHPVVWEFVQCLARRRPGPVVPNRYGRHFSPAALSITLSQRLTAAGEPGLTLHRYRHRFATRLLMPRELGGAGADVRTVQELMGHASLASTQIYTQVTSRQRREAIAALSSPTAPDTHQKAA